MQTVLIALVGSLAALFRSWSALQLEVLALRHQLAVYQRAGHRPQLTPADRLLWTWLSRLSRSSERALPQRRAGGGSQTWPRRRKPVN